MKKPHGRDKPSDKSGDNRLPLVPDLGYQRVVEGINDSLCTFDLNGYFTFINDVLCRNSGYPREWFSGKQYSDLIQAVNQDKLHDCIQAALNGKSTQGLEVIYPDKENNTVWIEVDISPILNDGSTVGILAISRDITEKKMITEELNNCRNNLEALIEQRTNQLLVANAQLQREIAEHKKTEEALRDSEEYYKAIFQNTGTAMVLMEDDTTICLVNKESVKFVGLTRRNWKVNANASNLLPQNTFKWYGTVAEQGLQTPLYRQDHMNSLF